MGGQPDSSFATLGPVLPQLRAGAPGRGVAPALALVPGVPTFAEAGGGNYLADAWYGVLAPAGLPQPIAQQLEKARRLRRAPPPPTAARPGLDADSVCGLRSPAGRAEGDPYSADRQGSET